MGLILSAVSVFLRDIFYIYGIVLTIWQYLTPIFYDISMIDPKLQVLFKYNPLYQFIDFTRQIILYNKIPSGETWAICGISGILVFLLGSIIFKAKQDKFIYYA